MYLNKEKDTELIADKESVALKYFPFETIPDKILKNKKYNGVILSPETINISPLKTDEKYKNYDELFDKIYNICSNKSQNYIYAYSLEPDYSMHCLGTNDFKITKIIEDLNKRIENLCSKLKNTLVIVLADHGHKDVKTIYLEDYPDLFNMLKQTTSIDSRSCALFVKDGCLKKFKLTFNQIFAKHFELLTSKKIIDRQIFGNGKNNKYFDSCIGDFIACATSNLSLKYKRAGHVNLSTHSGITKEEMLVPLIIIDKK